MRKLAKLARRAALGKIIIARLEQLDIVRDSRISLVERQFVIFAVVRFIIIDITAPDVIQKIWEKGISVDGYDANLYRQDFAGAWIARDKYGNTESMLGWEIDHVYPTAKGGDNHFINLRPMNWQNNRSKGDDFPDYLAVVTSEKSVNIQTEANYTVNQKLVEELKKLYEL